MHIRLYRLRLDPAAAEAVASAPGARMTWSMAEARPGDLLLLGQPPEVEPERRSPRLALVLQRLPAPAEVLVQLLQLELSAVAASVEADTGPALVPVDGLRSVLAELGLPAHHPEVARWESAARTLAYGVPLPAVEALLKLTAPASHPWGAAVPVAPGILTSLRRADATRPSDASRGRAEFAPTFTAGEPGRELLRLGASLSSDGRLRPGDLLTSVVFLPPQGDPWAHGRRATEVAEALDRWLGLSVRGSDAPARLNGQSELKEGEGEPAVEAFLDMVEPREPLEVLLTTRFEFPLEVGGTSRCPAWQAALYLEPPAAGGWRLNSLPPVTWIVLFVTDPAELVLLDYALDLHQRARSRVFAEEYLAHVPAGATDGRPQPWVDEELQQAVHLVRSPGPVLASERGSAVRSDAVSRLFEAAVQAKAVLVRQELALGQRLSGATWKIEIQRADLGVLCRPSREEDSSVLAAAHWVLVAPTEHYVSQLGEVRAHLADLNARGSELFALVSATSDRALLLRTDAARRAGIIAGFVTGILAVVAVFAALAAIPMAESRAINPMIRNVSLAGLLVVGALLLGGAASVLAARPPAGDSRAARAVRELAPRHRSRRDRVLSGLEAVLVVAAVTAFVVGVLSPSLPVVLLAWALVVTSVMLHLLRQEY